MSLADDLQREDRVRTVAVTGVSGFVGGAVARYLTAAGMRVQALVRRGSDVPRCEELGFKIVRGDLHHEVALRALLHDADAVVHCAGAVRGRSQQDFRITNVSGLARLAGCAFALETPPPFLSISSLAARAAHLSFYATSKLEGEETLRSMAGARPWCALRPPAIYGPGDRELRPLMKAMAHGILPILGSSEARFSLLYVEDLAAAVVAWLKCFPAPCGVFELHDGRSGGYSWADLATMAADFRGRRVVSFHVPRAVLQGLAYASDLGSRITGRAPMLSAGKVRELTHHDWVCDNRLFTQATGWMPSVRFQEGLRRTLAATH